MIFTSDKDYKSTKKIKQGISKIKEEFEPLAKWIDQKFEVKTLNIKFDCIKNSESHPRLQICLEYAKDKGKFMNNNNTCNFSKRKQKEISKKFKEIAANNERQQKSSLMKKHLGLTYKTDDLYVYFTDFESIAKIEANESIPKKKIENLKLELNNTDVWGISKAFSGATYFLFTDKQLKKYRNSETHKKWNEQYFDLLKDYDEFGYFKKDYFSVYLDSKENFDTKYDSNWYYYYK